jgi:hypothetical protein
MARHRRRRRDRPTIVIPGSSQLPGRPVTTTALVAVGLLATPGLVQMGTGDSGPLEGSAQLRPPTNALGVPSLNDYDSEGRLTLDAVPGAISTVAITQLPSEPVQISPAVAAAVAETIKQQEPSPLEAAMAFGPDDVETVKINDLGVPVVVGSSSADSADLLAGEVVPALGEAEEPGAEAEVGGSSGLALGGDPEGTGETGPGEAEGTGALLGGYAPIPGSDREAERDAAEGGAVGGYAPDAPEGSGSTTPCPDEEALPVSGWVEGSDGAGGSGVEGRDEAPTGTSGAEDSGSDWPVQVVDRPTDVEVDAPDDLPVDSPVDVDLPRGSGDDDPADTPDRDPVPGEDLPTDTVEPVTEPEPVVVEIVDEVEEEAPSDSDSPAEDDSEPAPAPEPADDGGESDAGDDGSDDGPAPVVDLPVDDAPDVDKSEKVREDESDKPDKLKEDDDHAGDTDREDAVPDSREDADEQGEESKGDRSSSDNSEDAPKDETRESDSDPGSGDEREHSDNGSEDDQSDSDSGDSSDSGSDSSDDGGESN